MSKYKFLKPTSVVICGAIVGYFSAQVFLAQNSPQSQNRFLASATISKLGSEQYARTFFDMKIKNERVANTADEVSVVKVSVEAFQKLPSGLTYSWHLPEGATLVEGLQTGSISELDVDQIQEFEIKVKGYSKATKNHVVFAIKGDINQSLIDRNVIVSSRPEDSFEYVVQAYESSEAQGKNKLGKSGAKNRFDPKNVVY